MSDNKLKLAILCGGQSPEHTISISSAKNVVDALDKNKYDVRVIYISRTGKWFLLDDSNDLKQDNLDSVFHTLGNQITPLLGEKEKLITLQGKKIHADVFFPLLHGKNGEDGTIQGLFQLANVPFVGCNTLSSALCMDKAIAKKLLDAAGISTAHFKTVRSEEKASLNFDDMTQLLGCPFFVKPANAGSSVGVVKVSDPSQFDGAITFAFSYDAKILLEECIVGREIEVSILGNGELKASLPGEIIPQKDFYDFNAKYVDTEGAILKKPAELPDNIIKKIQVIAKQAFHILNCEGMARVDFFVKDSGDIVLNELNTIPGFTEISMYPQLWEVTGMPYSDLLDELIHLSQMRFKKIVQIKQ